MTLEELLSKTTIVGKLRLSKDLDEYGNNYTLWYDDSMLRFTNSDASATAT